MKLWPEPGRQSLASSPSAMTVDINFLFFTYTCHERSTILIWVSQINSIRKLENSYAYIWDLIICVIANLLKVTSKQHCSNTKWSGPFVYFSYRSKSEPRSTRFFLSFFFVSYYFLKWKCIIFTYSGTFLKTVKEVKGNISNMLEYNHITRKLND